MATHITKVEKERLASESLEVLKGYLSHQQIIYWQKVSESKTSGSYRFYILFNECDGNGVIDNVSLVDLTYHIARALGIRPTDTGTLRVTATGINRPLSIVEKLMCAVRAQKWGHLPPDVYFRCQAVV